MRRATLVLVVLGIGLLVPTPIAQAKGSGCPATRTPFVEVAYVLEEPPSIEDTSLWQFMFVDTGVGEATMEFFGVGADEAYFLLAEFVDARVDRINDDNIACMNWIGENPGQPDFLVSVVDNTSNANK